MKFWDASALVPLYVQQSLTARMRKLLRDDSSVVAWWGSPIECVSAFCRLEREGALSNSQVNSAVRSLRSDMGAWHEVQPLSSVRSEAQRLLRVHSLRAADSLQLAAAVVASGGKPYRLGLVCSDERLASAAMREGFEVIA